MDTTSLEKNRYPYKRIHDNDDGNGHEDSKDNKRSENHLIETVQQLPEKALKKLRKLLISSCIIISWHHDIIATGGGPFVTSSWFYDIETSG